MPPRSAFSPRAELPRAETRRAGLPSVTRRAACADAAGRCGRVQLPRHGAGPRGTQVRRRPARMSQQASPCTTNAMVADELSSKERPQFRKTLAFLNFFLASRRGLLSAIVQRAMEHMDLAEGGASTQVRQPARPRRPGAWWSRRWAQRAADGGRVPRAGRSAAAAWQMLRPVTWLTRRVRFVFLCAQFVADLLWTIAFLNLDVRLAGWKALAACATVQRPSPAARCLRQEGARATSIFRILSRLGPRYLILSRFGRHTAPPAQPASGWQRAADATPPPLTPRPYHATPLTPRPFHAVRQEHARERRFEPVQLTWVLLAVEHLWYSPPVRPYHLLTAPPTVLQPPAPLGESRRPAGGGRINDFGRMNSVGNKNQLSEGRINDFEKKIIYLRYVCIEKLCRAGRPGRGQTGGNKDVWDRCTAASRPARPAALPPHAPRCAQVDQH